MVGKNVIPTCVICFVMSFVFDSVSKLNQRLGTYPGTAQRRKAIDFVNKLYKAAEANSPDQEKARRLIPPTLIVLLRIGARSWYGCVIAV